MKKYYAKCSDETVEQAMEWGIFDTEKEAIKSGFEGIENGMGDSFRLVEVTYKLMKKNIPRPR